MPTPIKLVSLDIDGTLYGPKGSAFDAKKIAAFQLLAKKLRSKGITPIICTGKPASYVEAFAEAYGLVGKGASHICEHGATIFVYESWKEHSYIDIVKLYASKDYSDLEKVAATIIKQAGGKKEEKMNSVSIINEGDPDVFYRKALSIMRGMGYNVIEGSDTSTKSAKEFFSLATAGKSDSEIKTEMQKKGYDFYASKSPTTINITPFPITKAFGLAYAAAKIHKCGLENVVAIGNDMGDMLLFDIAGLPIAVSNSDDDTKKLVKKRGGIVTKKKSIEGVIDAMKLLLKCKTIEEVKGKFSGQ